MFISELFEATATKTLVIIPGGFHPFHPGHLSLYRSAEQAFPGAEIYYAATDDKKERPFAFTDKEILANIAGVPKGHFRLVKSPFQAKEITQHFDPNTTVLVFARSEKDRDEQPKPGGMKKDGTPAYLQPYSTGKLAPMSQHGYMAYLPTIQFDAGPSGVTSATQIRNMWPRADDSQKNAIVDDLYPRNPSAAKQILDKYLGGAVAEGRENYNGLNLLLQKDDEELFVKASAGGRELGHVLFVIDGDTLSPQDLEVDERYRGQGIAQTMYDFVKSKGYRIRRSGQQTDAGAGFWNKHRPEQNVWEQGVAEDIDPDLYEDLDPRIIARAAKRVVPDLKARSTPEGYVHLTSARGLDLYIGCNVADGEISINLGSGGGVASSGEDKGAVTEIIKAVHDAAVKTYGQPSKPGSLSVDDDAGHGVWQHIASKLGLEYSSQSIKEQNMSETVANVPTIGINVRNDGNIDYAGLIVDGKKKYESRKTDSLRPYVGKTVGIVRTGSGPAVAIGQVTIGEPIVVDAEKFDRLRKQHLVPQGSKFDIAVDGTKYLYPMINPIRWDKEKLIKHRGIVSRKIQERE